MTTQLLADALKVADDIERLRGEAGDCGEPFYVTPARAQTWINTLRTLSAHAAEQGAPEPSAEHWRKAINEKVASVGLSCLYESELDWIEQRAREMARGNSRG